MTHALHNRKHCKWKMTEYRDHRLECSWQQTSSAMLGAAPRRPSIASGLRPCLWSPWNEKYCPSGWATGDLEHVKHKWGGWMGGRGWWATKVGDEGGVGGPRSCYSGFDYVRCALFWFWNKSQTCDPYISCISWRNCIIFCCKFIWIQLAIALA